jgi:multiple antibiotic resistance protein
VTILSATLLLILVLDPFGNIPFFLVELERVDPSRHRTILLRELAIALAALLVFLFAGQFLLDSLGISEPAVNVAGGIILFLIAIRMIFPWHRGSLEEDLDGEPFVVPLASPYVAGPSAFVSVMLIVKREPQRWPEWLLATLLAWLVTALLVYFASGLRRVLGKRGLVAAERLMGMVLVTIAVEMLLDGVAAFLAAPRPF